MKPSFRDVLCGYFSARETGKAEDDLFRDALREFSYFPESRALKAHRTFNGVVYTDSIADDHHADDGFFSVFVGYASGLSSIPRKQRELARFFSKKTWRESDFFDFVDSRFAGVVMDRKTNTLRLTTDAFGKRKIFYKLVDDVVFFSTELHALYAIQDPKERLNEQALRDYLTYGTVIGPDTISASIFSVPPYSYVEFDGRTPSPKPLPFPEKSTRDEGAVRPEDVYERFKEVLSFLHEHLDFKFSDLTGGTDTRLLLKAAQDLKLDLVYTCEDRNLQEGSADHFDFQVMELLADKFRLPTEFAFSGYRSNSRFHKSPFGTHRHYFGDIYNDCLSGMFGGELFGGWGVSHFFSPEKKQEALRLDREILAAFPEGFFNQTVSFERRLAEAIERTPYADPEVLLSVSFLYSGALNDRNHEPVWLESYLLSARKLSPFLGDAVLRSLEAKGMTKRLSNYRFYMELYERVAPEMLKLPFHSGFCGFFPKVLKDIRPPAKPLASTESASSPPPLAFDRTIHERMKGLDRYLGEFPSLSSFRRKLEAFSPPERPGMDGFQRT